MRAPPCVAGTLHTAEPLRRFETPGRIARRKRDRWKQHHDSVRKRASRICRTCAVVLDPPAAEASCERRSAGRHDRPCQKFPPVAVPVRQQHRRRPAGHERLFDSQPCPRLREGAAPHREAVRVQRRRSLEFSGTRPRRGRRAIAVAKLTEFALVRRANARIERSYCGHTTVPRSLDCPFDDSNAERLRRKLSMARRYIVTVERGHEPADYRRLTPAPANASSPVRCRPYAGTVA